MTNQRFFERLDAMVRWTGVPALAEGKPRRRPLRGPATLALVLAATGYAMVLASQRYWLAGYIILTFGMSVGNFMRIFGPLKPWGSMERVDEWDEATRYRAVAFTYAIMSITAPLGLILLAACANLAGWDMPRLSMALTATALFLMTLVSAMPTAHASWTVRWDKDEQGH
ncbi:hypothetical protein ACFX59_16570 [Sphingomonas sp. NCPPB 2930]|uniref:hypothetical protein n=1 Tax=Sphingomonas sp. NCPPB 2930 TaxID=3162788 RepID=UPI0036DA20B3